MALNPNNYTFRLDMVPSTGNPPSVFVSQGDIGRPFTAELYWGGVAWTPSSGTTCKIRGRKSDDTVFEYSATISGGTVTFSTQEQMTIVSGKTSCELSFSQENVVIASANFNMFVEEAPYDPDAVSESLIPGINDVIDNRFSDGSVTTAKLANNSVTSAKIADGAVTTADLADGSVINVKIADGAVTSAKIADGTIATSDIKDNAITTAKIKDGEVTLDKLAGAAVDTSKLADGAVTNRKLANNSINSAKIMDGAVTTVDIADLAVTTPKLADGAVTSAKIADGTINSADIRNSAVITAKIADEAVTSAKLADGAVENTKLAAGAVTYAKIANGAVVNAKIADGAVTPVKTSGLATTSDIANVLAAVETAQAGVASANAAIETLQNALGTKFDDAELTDEGLLNFLSNGQVVVGPLGPFAGGGGGGGGGSSGNNATITATNTSGWTTTQIAYGAPCEFSFSWSSTEDGNSTGPGTLKVYVGGALRLTQNINQGSVNLNFAPYLSVGTNSVMLQISDVYGNRRTMALTVNAIALTLTSTFDASVIYSGPVNFPFTPTGSLSKIVYFVVDGTVIDTMTTSVSGRQLTYTIPSQEYGSHSIRCYFECTVNNETIRSNELYYEFMSVGEGDGDPIITSNAQATGTFSQWASEAISYTVYDPNSLTADVVIKVNGDTFQEVTVNRTAQTVTIRYDEPGTTTITITCGATTKTFTRTITESQADIGAVTDDLALYLTSYGRSNNEEHPETWTYDNISCTLSNFGYVTDGWLTDDDDNDVLRVAGNARVTVPYKFFGTDFRSTGKTIEIEFATRDVMNYDSVIMTCMQGGKGIEITSREASMSSEQTEVDTQFKEDEHIRLSFVTQKRAENRLVFIYINGIASRVVQYPSNDDFEQVNPADFVIGSNYATVDIYNIRVYDNDLTSQQILGNWVADTQDVEEMLARHARNDVFDEYGQIVISKLPSDLPYCVITGDLPTYKGDKKTVEIAFYNPAQPSKNFTATGVQIDVQGTSSAGYARKNFKPKFKRGFELANGSHSDTYQINAQAIPTNCFCFKADVASSEGANNVELVRLYNRTCPYETPAQEEDERVRQGIDGFPMVVFNTVNGETTFVGKYNFNNDKSTSEVFGFTTGDESWEVLNNTSNRVIFKSADYTGSGWLNDFEARYPDTDPPYQDPAQLAEFAEWLVSTDTTAATNNNLAEPVTYDEVEYTKDTAEYRLAKFKAEAGDYMELESAIFYYLFTEQFLMVDSRAKNMFPSFIGEEITNE